MLLLKKRQERALTSLIFFHFTEQLLRTIALESTSSVIQLFQEYNLPSQIGASMVQFPVAASQTLTGGPLSQ